MHWFLPDEALSFREMAAQADSSLCETIISNPNHVLRTLCTLRPTIQYHLRPRPHPFSLRTSDKRNCLSRVRPCPFSYTNNKLPFSSGTSHHNCTANLHHFSNTLFFISIREFILILCIYRPTVNGCVQGWQVFAERW